MTSDQLVKEAAERLLTKWTATSVSYDSRGKPHMEYVEDLATIADAYLRLVPADEDGPIDEAWLKSVGFQSVLGRRWFHESDKNCVLEIDIAERWIHVPGSN